MRNAQMRQQQMVMQQQQATQTSEAKAFTSAIPSSQYVTHSMGSTLDDIPVQDADINSLQNSTISLESACREGDLAKVQTLVTSQQSTPRFLHPGLVSALAAGRVETARYLLSAGAVIGRAVPNHVLAAPQDQKIPLLEVLTQHGWTPNTPGFYGEVLLPSTVGDLALLRWFLDHGADPNLGAQRDSRDRMGPSETKSCSALEAAASRGSVEAVRSLLDAGARVEHGLPLHCAAGAHPKGTNLYEPPVHATREFDEDRVPVMQLLVEAGADVNKRDESRYMVPRLPVLLATMAGAIERVRWLVEHGADPAAEGGYGSAVSHARRYGSEEMKNVVEGAVGARS